jgi:hypothetical protein
MRAFRPHELLLRYARTIATTSTIALAAGLVKSPIPQWRRDPDSLMFD